MISVSVSEPCYETLIVLEVSKSSKIGREQEPGAVTASGGE